MSLKREWPHVLKAIAAVPVLFSVLWLPLRSGGTEPLHLGLAEVMTLAAVLALGLRGRILLPNSHTKSFLFALGLTIFAAALSTSFSKDLSASVPALFSWLWLGGLALLTSFISSDHRYSKFLVSGLIATGLIQASWSYFVWWGGGDAASTQSGTFYAPNQYAGYLLLVAPIPLTAALRTSQRREAASWGFVAVMLYTSVLITGSRAGIAAAVIGATLPAAVLLRDKPKRVGLRLTLMLTSMVAAALFTTSELLFPSSAPSGGALTALSEKRGMERTSSFARIHWVQGALLIWREAPITGSGLGTYGDMLVQVQDPTWLWSRYAHNHYLESLADGGILFAVGVAALSFQALVRKSPDRDEGLPTGWRAGVWGGLIGGTAHLVVDYDWTFPAYAATYVIAAVVLSASGHDKESQTTSPLSRRSQLAIVLVGAVASVAVIANLVSFLLTRSGPASAEHLSTAIRLAPYSNAPRLALASSLAGSAEPEQTQVRTLLTEAMFLDELDPYPLWTLARLRASTNDVEGARSLLRRAKQVAPAAPRSYMDSAGFELDLGNDALTAAAILDEGIQRLSMHPGARSRLVSPLAEMLLLRSRAEEKFWGASRAINYANQAAELAPSSVGPIIRLAELSCRVGNLTKTRDYAARLAVLDPSGAAADEIPANCRN